MSTAAITQGLKALRVPTKVLAAAGFALTIETFLLISLGGLVRNAGAGLSCPDWPLCFGQVVPPMDYQVFLEWFHRLMAGSISVFLLGLSLAIALNAELRAKVGVLCVMAVCFLAGQVVLGGLTVLGLLGPHWVSSHLAVALLFFGTSLVMTLKLIDSARPARAAVAPRRLMIAAFGATGVLYLQILLGGLVSSNYAGLACTDFPTCNGAWVPAFDGLVAIHFLHRVGAVVATTALVAFFALARKRVQSRRGRAALLAVPALLGVQVFFGVSAVLMKLPLPVSVAHLATATALWAMLLVVTYEIRRGY